MSDDRAGLAQPQDRATKDPMWDVVRVVITVLTIIFGIWAYTVASEFRPRAAYFPVAASGIIVVFGTLQLVQDLRNLIKGRPVVIPGLDVESLIFGLGARGLLPALRYIAWFVAYAAMIYVAGVLVGSLVFVLLFLLTEARWSALGSVVGSLGITLMAAVMIRGLELRVPRTLLDIGHSLLR